MKFATTKAGLPLTLAILTVASSALAGDYDGISDGAKVQLQSYKSWMSDCLPEVVGKYPATIDKCEALRDKQKVRLESVPVADRSHPKYREFSAHQGKLEAAIEKRKAELKEEEKKTDGMRATAEAMRADLATSSKLIYLLDDIAHSRPTLHSSKISPSDAAERATLVPRIEQLAKDCTGKYKDVLSSSDLSSRAQVDRMPSPTDSCTLARGARSALARWTTEAASAWAKSFAEDQQKHLKPLVDDGTFDDDLFKYFSAAYTEERINEATASYQKLAAVVGTTVPRSTFEGWATTAASVPTAIQAAAKKKRALGRFKADDARNAIRTTVQGNQLSLVDYGVRAQQPSIEKNDLGMPLYKRWVADVVVKKASESYCRVYVYNVTSPYAGGGRYGAWQSGQLGTAYEIGSCK